MYRIHTQRNAYNYKTPKIHDCWCLPHNKHEVELILVNRLWYVHTKPVWKWNLEDCATVLRSYWKHCNAWRYQACQYADPFTVPSCQFFWLKNAHVYYYSIHTYKQIIFWAYNKSTFNVVHFDENLFAC